MKLNKFLLAPAILLKIADAVLLADVTVGQKVDCSAYPLDQLVGMESQALFCSDNRSIIIHANKLKLSHEQLGLHKREEWIQLLVGDLKTTKSPRRPLASCASSADGSGVLRSSLDLDTRKITMTGSFDFKVNIWLEFDITLSTSLAATLERQNEYVCLAPEGQMVQMMAYFLEHTFSEWMYRSVLTNTPTSEFSEWIEIPEFTIRDTVEQVECVTDESLLGCTEL